MEARERKVINKSGLLGRTVTADYGHSSAYHTLRLDDRFSMMGVLEIWKKERTSGNAFVVITKRVKSLIINPSGGGIEDDKGSVLEKLAGELHPSGRNGSDRHNGGSRKRLVGNAKGFRDPGSKDTIMPTVVSQYMDCCASHFIRYTNGFAAPSILEVWKGRRR